MDNEPTKRKRATKAELVKAIERTRGNYTGIGRLLGITRQAVGQRISRDPLLKALVLEQREKLLDCAEVGLAKAVRAQKSWAIKFILATAGRSRGYTRTINVDANIEQGGSVVLYLPHNNRDKLEEKTS